MSPEPDQPLTRAQLRAQRAAEAAAAEAAQHPVPPVPDPTAPIEVGLPPTPARRSTFQPALAEPRAPGTPETPAMNPGTDPGSERSEHPEPQGRPPRPGRRFGITLAAVLGVLVLAFGALGAVSMTQGPRLSGVQADASGLIQAAGSVTLTMNRTVDAITAGQVTIAPAVPFTVHSAGRSLDVRFSRALNDSTTYTVKVAGVTGEGGGPTGDVQTSFTTPASRILLLQRAPGAEKDTIFTTDLSGKRATPVFSYPRIDDYRADADVIVVAVEDSDGSRLIVMNRDGSGQRDLKLPGVGYVSAVQLSERGGFVGYSYTDRDLTETSGRAGVLATQRLDGTGRPQIVQVGGKDVGVAEEWQFLPDSSSLLLVDFNGDLSLADPAKGTAVTSMGKAAGILGVSRADDGRVTAIVERTEGEIVQLDLASQAETPLPASDPDYGDADAFVPFPGGTLRHIVQRDASGLPTGQAVVRVDDKGAATVVTEVSGTDSIVQTCVAPSGQYAAVVIAPDLTSNTYDDLLLPLPSTLHTQLFDLDGTRKLPTLSGFDISWCGQPPQ